MAETGIQWTQGDDGSPGMTWNPTTGCDRISPGCDHCYALTMAKRLKAMGQAKYQTDGDPRTSGPGFGLAVHPDALNLPFHWHKPRRVFVNSMSDLGHARIPADFQAQVWAVMAATPQHTYQVLSKRPERLRRLLDSDGFVGAVGRHWATEASIPDEAPWRGWPLPNVWVGTSIELDKYTRRADELRATPAAVRFLSLEPLLGPLPSLDLTGIDWVIIGGESGGGARPCELGWIEEIVGACHEAGIAVFVKQLGAVLGAEFGAGSHGADIECFPAYLQHRHFPRVPEAMLA